MVRFLEKGNSGSFILIWVIKNNRGGNVVRRVWSQVFELVQVLFWSVLAQESKQCQMWSISLVQFCVEGVWQLQRTMISARMLQDTLGSLGKGQVSTAPVVVIQIWQLPWPNTGCPWPSTQWEGAQQILWDFLVSNSSSGGAASLFNPMALLPLH